jgi:hypothetical protein
MHACLVFFALLVVGLSSALPVEDLPSTAYDESEAQAYESNPSISSLMEKTGSTTQTVPSETRAVRNGRFQTSTLFSLTAKPTHRIDAHRITVARSLLAHVCTLLF